MTKAIARFTPEACSRELQQLAASLSTDIESLITHVEFAFPEMNFGRREARMLIRYVTSEREMDEMASVPTSLAAIDGVIDRALFEEAIRLERENALLEKISKKDPGMDYTIGESKEIVSPEESKVRIQANVDRLLKLKGAVSARVKSEGEGAGVNVNVNLGTVVNQALENIRAVEQGEKSLDAVQVEATISDAETPETI